MTAAAIDRDDVLLCEACSEFVTKAKMEKSTVSYHDIKDTAIPQGLTVVRGLVASKFSVRVLAYLSEAERRTEVANEQEIYRIAWLTVLRADEGNPDPWRSAFWEIVGNTPEKAIPFWLCRADLFTDEYVPLSMLDLKYTASWGSDYIRAKMAADAARGANLPPKKPVTSLPDFKIERRRKSRLSKGYSVWPSLVCAVTLGVVFVLLVATHTSKTYSYSWPDHSLRVVQNLDPCDSSDGSCGKRYLVQSVDFGVPNPETEMHFREVQHFEAGHTFSWIKFKYIGSEVVTDGWDLVRKDGFAVLAPNCKPDYSKAPTAGHIRCEGRKARF